MAVVYTTSHNWLCSARPSLCKYKGSICTAVFALSVLVVLDSLSCLKSLFTCVPYAYVCTCLDPSSVAIGSYNH